MIREPFRGLDAFTQGTQFPIRFQWITRCDDPPHPIDAEPPQSRFSHETVPLVRRIERAAEQSDGLSR